MLTKLRFLQGFLKNICMVVINMIYLDNAATTYPKPREVYEALDFAHKNLSFNAGRGAYKKSRDCLLILESFRKGIATLCKGDYREVAILSSATEALNLIINGVDWKDGMNVYVTPFEHNAIIRPLYNIKKRVDIKIHVLPFNKATWEPELTKIENSFALDNPDVVFSSQISNVTGMLINYSAVFGVAKKYKCITVLDAAQGFGVLEVNSINTDFIVFAGHKSLYGPFGVGGFINLSNLRLNITKSGGNGSDTLNHNMPESGHERYETGSPNVPAVYGNLAGLKWLKNNNVEKHEVELTHYLIDSLESIEKVSIYAPNDKRKLFGIVSISVDGYTADEVGHILADEFDICIRTGFHCAPLIHEFLNSTINGGTVRISISGFSKKEDVDALISALKTF